MRSPVTALAGLLFGARGLYTPDPATLPAFIGQDAITLAGVLPLLLWSVRAAAAVIPASSAGRA